MFITSTPSANCDFKLKDGKSCFYGGDSLAGNVTLNVFRKLQLESITLALVGGSHVLWHEKLPFDCVEHNDCARLDENSIKYEAKREFLNLQKSISQAIILEDDKISNDFEFQLPNNLPATYKDEFAETNYELQMILQRRTKSDLIFKKEILVKRRLDLNTIPELDEFVSAAMVASDNEITLQLPYAGFVPGQVIAYSLQIAKILTKPNLVISLCQLLKYKGEKPEARFKEVKNVLDFKRNCNANGFLKIPLIAPITTTPSTITTTTRMTTTAMPPDELSDLIEITYYVEAVVLNAEHNVQKKLQIPIIVGTKKLNVARDFIDNDFEEETNLYCYDNYALRKVAPPTPWICSYETMSMEQAADSTDSSWERYRKRHFVLPFKSVWQIFYNELIINSKRS